MNNASQCTETINSMHRNLTLTLLISYRNPPPLKENIFYFHCGLEESCSSVACDLFTTDRLRAMRFT